MTRIIALIYGFIILFSSCIKEEVILNDNDEEEIVNNITNKENNEDDSPTEAMEKQVVEIVNAERKKQNLAPLSVDESLMKSCDIRAKELVNSFSHTRPDGSSCFTSIETNYNAAGENIAYGQNSAQAVMTSWMNSEGHRNNILSDKYTHIGVGCYENGNRLYWVQLFIRKKDG